MKKKRIVNSINEELNLDESDRESDDILMSLINWMKNEIVFQQYFNFYGFNSACYVLVIHY